VVLHEDVLKGDFSFLRPLLQLQLLVHLRFFEIRLLFQLAVLVDTLNRNDELVEI